MSGRLTADFTDGQVSLSSERAELHDDLLRTVPYVPREVWDHIGASGQMGAAVALSSGPRVHVGSKMKLPLRVELPLYLFWR